MCNHEISSRRIDWSFPRSSTTIRGRSLGGGVVPTPPPDRPRYEKCPDRARVNPRPAGPSPDPTLCWGGPYRPPHLSRKPTDVGEKFKRQWKGLDEIFQIKFKNLTSRSPVTSQVRSNTKCLTFPFNAFPRQNAGNKRISSR